MAADNSGKYGTLLPTGWYYYIIYTAKQGYWQNWCQSCSWVCKIREPLLEFLQPSFLFVSSFFLQVTLLTMRIGWDELVNLPSLT